MPAAKADTGHRAPATGRRTPAWLNKNRAAHALGDAWFRWDHNFGSDEKIDAKEKLWLAEFQKALILQTAAELGYKSAFGLPLSSRGELTAQQYGAVVMAIRAKMEKQGVPIPKSGKKRTKEEVTPLLVLEMLGQLRSMRGQEAVDRLIRRQLGRRTFDDSDPDQVKKLFGALKGTLRHAKKKKATA